MKKIVCVLGLIVASKFCHSQINEKDTILTTIVAKQGSVQLQVEVLPDYINLNWTKGPHEYIQNFELYRSPDGVAYNIIRQFNPTTFDNTANYFSFRDEDPLRGKNYYRLVSYDKFTNEKRTLDIIADFKNQPRRLQPTVVQKNNQLNITNYDGEEMELWIYSSGGTPILRKVIASSTINLPDDLARGAYVYQLVNRRMLLISNGKFILQ